MAVPVLPDPYAPVEPAAIDLDEAHDAMALADTAGLVGDALLERVLWASSLGLDEQQEAALKAALAEERDAVREAIRQDCGERAAWGEYERVHYDAWLGHATSQADTGKIRPRAAVSEALALSAQQQLASKRQAGYGPAIARATRLELTAQRTLRKLPAHHAVVVAAVLGYERSALRAALANDPHLRNGVDGAKPTLTAYEQVASEPFRHTREREAARREATIAAYVTEWEWAPGQTPDREGNRLGAYLRAATPAREARASVAGLAAVLARGRDNPEAAADQFLRRLGQSVHGREWAGNRFHESSMAWAGVRRVYDAVGGEGDGQARGRVRGGVPTGLHPEDVVLVPRDSGLPCDTRTVGEAAPAFAEGYALAAGHFADLKAAEAWLAAPGLRGESFAALIDLKTERVRLATAKKLDGPLDGEALREHAEVLAFHEASTKLGRDVRHAARLERNERVAHEQARQFAAHVAKTGPHAPRPFAAMEAAADVVHDAINEAPATPSAPVPPIEPGRGRVSGARPGV